MKKFLCISVLALLTIGAFSQEAISISLEGSGGGSATLDSSLTTTTTFDYAVVIEGNEGMKAGVTTSPAFDTVQIGAAYYIGSADSTWIEKPLGTWIKREDE